MAPGIPEPALQLVEHKPDSARRPGTPVTSPPRNRFRVLPGSGALIVSTDLHGNGDDFRALRERFERLRSSGCETHWALLGDFVHAPSEQARKEHPGLYDFDDESWFIVEQLSALVARHPEHVHVVVGNHDYGHLGGFRTSKFHRDEVAHLESQLSPGQIAALRQTFAAGYLVLAAPCGVLMAHGAPGSDLRSPEQLDGITLGAPRSDAEARLLQQILTSYGQPRQVAEAMLERMSRATGLPLRVVVHGHDRCETGWFTEGGNQLQPVLFGAPRHEKRYLELDLAARYESVDQISDGREIRRLYGAG